jgi:transcriptional repressor NrdR
VVKRDGRRIEYERAKLQGSFQIALRKRPVSTELIDAAIERIEDRLLNLGQREIDSSRLGELVMDELKGLDKVGYIRFASVYRSFEDVDDFKNIMDEVRSPKAKAAKKPQACRRHAKSHPRVAFVLRA